MMKSKWKNVRHNDRVYEPSETTCFRNPTNTLARREPNGDPIDMLSTCQYIVSLKLKERDLVANSINSINICSGKDRLLEWRYK